MRGSCSCPSCGEIVEVDFNGEVWQCAKCQEEFTAPQAEPPKIPGQFWKRFAAFRGRWPRMFRAVGFLVSFFGILAVIAYLSNTHQIHLNNDEALGSAMMALTGVLALIALAWLLFPVFVFFSLGRIEQQLLRMGRRADAIQKELERRP